MFDPSMMFMMLSRGATDNGVANIALNLCVALLLIPMLKIVTENYTSNFDTWFSGSSWYSKYKYSLKFQGHEVYNSGYHRFQFPYPLLAICHALMNERRVAKAVYINKDSNGKYVYRDELANADTDMMHYILDAYQQFNYSPTLRIEFSKQKVQNEKQRDNIWTIDLTLASSHSLKEIEDFISAAVVKYKTFMDRRNRNKIYHFIYKGQHSVEDEEEPWSAAVLSDLDDPGNTNYETFDTLFTPNKASLLTDLERLKDFDYYKRTGQKRKKGYIFYGPPGCGKTSSVIAMANHDRRHILEIPMSRVKTNGEIEDILNLTSIGGVDFTKEQIILLFDEIDVGSEALKKRDAERACDVADPLSMRAAFANAPTPAALLAAAAAAGHQQQPGPIKPTDSICLGTLLSRLDGVGSYNGVIIVATTNCIDQLSPAIYRHGRLNPVQFDYMNQTDMIKMIEAFYDVALTDEQISRLPTYEHEITPASLRYYMEQNAKSLPRLIDYLRTMPTVMRPVPAATAAALQASPALISMPLQQQAPVKNGSVFDYIRL
jgi:DNA replication protein DnaC